MSHPHANGTTSSSQLEYVSHNAEQHPLEFEFRVPWCGVGREGRLLVCAGGERTERSKTKGFLVSHVSFCMLLQLKNWEQLLDSDSFKRVLRNGSAEE